jgi:succinyl-CoA synthetase beta subunit
MRELLDRSRTAGWVMEPQAKALLRDAGLTVPAFACADTADAAAAVAAKIGYPVAAKVVSAKIVHKSDVGGVALDLKDESALREAFGRFSTMDGFSGMLVEQMVTGVEMIIGAKVDHQFGPVVLLGIGGTGVEIYQDVAIRMAPLTDQDAASMMKTLVGRRLLEGFRGGAPIDRMALAKTLVVFSELAMAAADWIESIDLNPVMCTAEACVIADARMMLA